MNAMVMKGLEGSTRVEIRLEFEPTSLTAGEVRQLAVRAQQALTDILKQSSSQAGEAGDREAPESRVDGLQPPDRDGQPPPPVFHVDLATGGVVEPSSTFTPLPNATVTQLPTEPRKLEPAPVIPPLPLITVPSMTKGDIFPRYEPKKPFGEFMNKKFDPDQARAAAAEALHATRRDL